MQAKKQGQCETRLTAEPDVQGALVSQTLPTRRDFLRLAPLLPGMLLGRAAWAGDAAVASVADGGFWERPRWVWVRRPETGEEVREVYWADGQLVAAGYLRLSWLLRDLHMEDRIRGILRRQAAGERVVVPEGWYSAVAMSPVLLDILYSFCGWLEYFGIQRPLQMSKGGAFRHPITNAVTEGAARDSRHQHAGAGDIVVTGVTAAATSNFALWLQAGGVGVYPARNFTHVDDGSLRFWKGH
jgi:hypothetical protein